MTESLSYLTTVWALYAIALALERPSVLRQFAVLGTVAAALLTRTQFGILYVTWVGGLACLWLLAPATRPRSRAELLRFWPTALPVVLGALAFVARLASGSSAKDTFGAYWELWRGYDPFAVAKWFVYHLGDFAVYLVVVPVAVAPIVLWELGRAGKAGSRRAAAFVSLFAAANVSGLLVVAAFTSTPWGYDRLHDRYGFYLVPLWLVALVVWLASGLPRPRVAAAIGAVSTLALALILPFAQLANEAGIDTVPGALWVRIEAELAGPGPASGRLALALFVAGLLAATFFLPRGIARLALPAAVAVGFAAMSYFAWQRISTHRRIWCSRAASSAPGSTIVCRRTLGDEALRRHAAASRRSSGTRSSSRSSSTRPSTAPPTSTGRPRTGCRSTASTSRPAARSSSRPAIRSGRSTSTRSRASSSPAGASGRERRPTSCSGTSTAPSASSGRRRTHELREAVCPTG